MQAKLSTVGAERDFAVSEMKKMAEQCQTIVSEFQAMADHCELLLKEIDQVCVCVGVCVYVCV